jgi:hypothetical protein
MIGPTPIKAKIEGPMTTEVYFPADAARIILADFRRLIRDGFQAVDYTPQLNFFLHLIGLLDSFNPQIEPFENPKGIELIWSFYFDQSLKQTSDFLDDFLAFTKRPLFSFPSADVEELLHAMQTELAEVVQALKSEIRLILEEEAWTLAKARWDVARDELRDDQPGLTVAQQNDHLPEYGRLVDEDEADTILTRRVRARLAMAASRPKAAEQRATQGVRLKQPILWETARAGRLKRRIQVPFRPAIKRTIKPLQQRTGRQTDRQRSALPIERKRHRDNNVH